MRYLYVLFALMILVTSATPTLAHAAVPNWESSSESTGYGCCWTRRTSGDSFRTSAVLFWDATKATNMRANRNQGHYFTFDQNDLSLNVDGYMISSSIPNIVVDFESNAGHRGRDEAELVSTSTTFPVNNGTYSAYVYWSRWYFHSGTGAWNYDGDAGTIEFVENLSTPGCPVVCDPYDTHCCNANLFLNRTYPAKAQAAATQQPADGAPMLSVEGTELTAPVDGGAPRAYQAGVPGDDNEVHLAVDPELDLAAYRDAADRLAQSVAQGGRAEGVVTFTKPISWRDLARLQRAGLEVQEVELVSEPGADGLRWTFAGSYGPGLRDVIDAAAADAKVKLLGIVSANVTVPDSRVLAGVTSDSSVYLVDLSVADFKRNNPEVVDVIQNDVYWALAGWE